jgi:hypothetical protein
MKLQSIKKTTRFIDLIIIFSLIFSFFNPIIVYSNEINTSYDSDIWAVIITVGDIKRDRYSVDALTKILFEQGCQNKNIKKLIEEDATKYKILNESFKWLNNNEIKEEDIVIFFFSMHGGRIEDQPPYDEPDNYDEYLVPYDYNNRTNIILDEELNEKINSIKSKNVVLIFETCYSGGMIDGLYDLSGSGRIVITSSDANESSWPMYLRTRWLFPNFFFKGLAGPADLNDDMIVSFEESFKYAEKFTFKRSALFAFFYSFIPFIPHEFYPQNPQIYDGWPSEEDNNLELKFVNLN